MVRLIDVLEGFVATMAVIAVVYRAVPVIAQVTP